MALSCTLYSMDVSDILDGLNEAQRSAVAAEQGLYRLLKKIVN